MEGTKQKVLDSTSPQRRKRGRLTDVLSASSPLALIVDESVLAPRQVFPRSSSLLGNAPTEEPTPPATACAVYSSGTALLSYNCLPVSKRSVEGVEGHFNNSREHLPHTFIC